MVMRMRDRVVVRDCTRYIYRSRCDTVETLVAHSGNYDLKANVAEFKIIMGVTNNFQKDLRIECRVGV